MVTDFETVLPRAARRRRMRVSVQITSAWRSAAISAAS
jgi:hypothetical protein